MFLNAALFVLWLSSLVIFPGCLRNYVQTTKTVKPVTFTVINQAGHDLYIACFTYCHKSRENRYLWYKTPVEKLTSGQSTIIAPPVGVSSEERATTYGCLGVFETRERALSATYPLMVDQEKVELDHVSHLNKKTILLKKETYGFKRPVYSLLQKRKYRETGQIPTELDFYVKNSTGRLIYATVFTYQKDLKHEGYVAEGTNDLDYWHYAKTPPKKIEPGETVKMNIETINVERDRSQIHGYLGIFEAHEKQEAEEATYELVRHHKKLNLGYLYLISNKAVEVIIEPYGIHPRYEKIVHHNVIPLPNNVDTRKKLP